MGRENAVSTDWTADGKRTRSEVLYAFDASASRSPENNTLPTFLVIPCTGLYEGTHSDQFEQNEYSKFEAYMSRRCRWKALLLSGSPGTRAWKQTSEIAVIQF